MQKLGLRVHATANAGAFASLLVLQLVPARNDRRVSCLSALQSRVLITNEPGRGERSVRTDSEIGDDLRGGQAVITVP